ncbi:hypothetical protein sphantq_04488 (plasmid) [Sphingobium sp. AntQ-1]|uniref:hypothetical protein n=1 Tax=Sphingobium sp. AntQ-1 TaxID=2930091 RepID=UPI00234F965A|nr:hypothetical protein [Sphingobium sp. AntQ-1]WCP15996.1 hypothetical protein sphantq_04488 [Sphingobium sp. AntQ-1]
MTTEISALSGQNLDNKAGQMARLLISMQLSGISRSLLANTSIAMYLEFVRLKQGVLGNNSMPKIWKKVRIVGHSFSRKRHDLIENLTFNAWLHVSDVPSTRNCVINLDR